MAALPLTKTSSGRSGSTLQKIAQKKEQLKLYPRMKKIERIATHLPCQVKCALIRTLIGVQGQRSIIMSMLKKINA